MQSDAKLTVKNATDTKTPPIRRLCEPNPTEDVPDQDSTENLEHIQHRILLTRAMLARVWTTHGNLVYLCVYANVNICWMSLGASLCSGTRFFSLLGIKFFVAVTIHKRLQHEQIITDTHHTPQYNFIFESRQTLSWILPGYAWLGIATL